MSNNWNWTPAVGTDVIAIKDMAESMFQTEINGIWIADPVAYMRNITQAIVNQYYSPGSELILVAKVDESIIGYVWVKRNQRSPWSDEETAVVQMVHVDLNLSARQRVRLIAEMIQHWETWAQKNGIPVVCSTTMRGDQTGFLKLHERCGYDVRGSYAYKRLVQSSVEHPDVLGDC